MICFKLYESEMRNASIEVEVRDEVAGEMQQTLQKMHIDYEQRFQDQASPGFVLHMLTNLARRERHQGRS